MTEPDDKKEELLAAEDDLLSRDPEVANRALERISQIFEDQEDRGKVSGNDPEEPDAAALDLTAETELTDVLSDLHPADIAYILEALPPEQRLAVWNLVRHEHEGDVLVEVSEGVRETLIDSMDREELVDAVEGLDTDEIADLVDDLPPDVVAEVQEGLSHEERAQLRAAMSYPEDSVGARMDFEMISIRQDVSLEIVLKFLRRFESLPDHTDQLFVVDRQGKFLGALPVAQILVHEPTRSVSSLMQSDILTLNPLDDASDAAQAFERYDLVSSPVVDEAGRLVGRLTVNEVVDVIREESAEDAYAAVGLDEEQDIFGSVWDSAKSRWVWLGVNLFTAFFASRVISAFDGTISKVVGTSGAYAGGCGHGRQFGQSDADASGAFHGYGSSDGRQHRPTVEKRVVGGVVERSCVGRYCGALRLGAVPRQRAGHDARRRDGLGDATQYCAGRGYGFGCSVGAQGTQQRPGDGRVRFVDVYDGLGRLFDFSGTRLGVFPLSVCHSVF